MKPPMHFHVRMKRQDTRPVEGSLQKLPTARYSLERPHWCMDIMKQRQRGDGAKAPYITDLNMKSDHAFMHLSWKRGIIRVWEGLSWACSGLDTWISTLKSGLGTDLIGIKEQKSSLLCDFKRSLSYWVFDFCFVLFISFTLQMFQVSGQVLSCSKRLHSIECLIVRT